jgi:hypothetical protein
VIRDIDAETGKPIVKFDVVERNSQMFPEDGEFEGRHLLCKDSRLRSTAFQMYMAGDDLADIAHKLNVSLEELSYYAYGESGSGKSKRCWSYLSKSHSTLIGRLCIADNRERIGETLTVALETLRDQIAKRYKKDQEEGTIASADDIQKLTDIVSKLDKIYRLDSGKATNITQNLNLTPEQQSKIGEIMGDPFAMVEGEDYEVKDD